MLNRMELTKNKKSNLLGQDNRLFDLCPVLRTKNRTLQAINQFFLKIKLDTLLNTHSKFYRKLMRITIKILSFKKAKFNIGHPLFNYFIFIKIPQKEFENHSMSALHIACKYGCENVARLLIEKFSIENLLLLDENKMLALHYACGCKIEKLNVVKQMIEKIISFNANENLTDMFLSKKNKYGDTPLNLAVKENHIQIVEILLKHLNLVKCNADNDKNLPIHNAAKTGSIEMLDLFASYDLISFEPNIKWNNVFHIAANENREQFIIYLFKKYASNSKEYEEQLNFALNSFNKDNFTPLECAIIKGSIDCVRIFIDRQIKNHNVDIKLFELSIEYNQKNVLKYLIEFNKNNLNKFLNGINCSNNTILHIACIHKNFKLFKLIIENILKGKQKDFENY